MEINLLALNVGNSRLSIATFVAGELASVVRIPHAQRSDWPNALREAWMPIAKREDAAVIGASVNPPLLEPLEHAATEITGERVSWIGRDIALPMKVRTKSPAQTGVDRVLNMAAAFEQLGKGCVVVDAGSAITVDCCTEAGEFLGGAIAPGLSMQLDALHERTAKLPRVQFQRPTGAFGDSTESAILHGMYHGMRGLVRELVESYATELTYWPDVIATGGDASILFEGWEIVHAVVPDLTMYGMALAYTEHHLKNPSE